MSDRRPRALWRLLLQAALLGVSVLLPIFLIAEPLTMLHRAGHFLPRANKAVYDRIINLIVGPLFTAGVVLSVWVAGRWLDKRRFREFGLVPDRRWWGELAGGLALGAGLMAMLFGVEHGLGYVEVTGTFAANAAGVPLALAFAFTAVKCLCVGVAEETFSRGYQLTNIAEGTGSVTAAVVLTALVFAVLHATNDNATAMSTAGLFGAGLMFAAARIVTGRLAAPIGLHISWNFVQGAVLGFPVSGDKEGASVLGIAQRGPEWLTGGAFGPEAGVLGIAAMAAGAAVFALGAKSRKHRPNVISVTIEP
ncbi:MAG TPA: CPBP family intramembrane glutamic endopeptidase [Thermoanaerobaculia bacterium]|nr:CPBP family intramembrane glutamic endopeptidase [Thermoanaerobaculia bacterium]